MPSPIEHQLRAQLESRKARSLLRSLVVIPESSADFSSNDFLGLARSPALNSRFLEELASFPKHAPPLGSTGSRLLDGNSRYAEDLEAIIADFHHAEAALIFNSGFDANVGFFSCVPQPGDVILYDEYIHASVHDGMKVTRAGTKKAFLHNDLEHLAQLLKTVRREDQDKAMTTGSRTQERNIFVAVESVYSMDGDTAPLREIVDLLEPFGAYLIVDEVDPILFFFFFLTISCGLTLKIICGVVRPVEHQKCLSGHSRLIPESRPMLQAYMDFMEEDSLTSLDWRAGCLLGCIPSAKHLPAMEVRRLASPCRFSPSTEQRRIVVAKDTLSFCLNLHRINQG